MDIDQIIRETGVDRDAIRVLADAGLEMEQQGGGPDDTSPFRVAAVHR
jgi:hypothetical protein